VKKKTAPFIDFGGYEGNAVLIAGQLAGLASRLDVDALERFLDSKPADFLYEKQCRAAIQFRKTVISIK